MASLRLDVWSDIACPWCYVGKRRLEAALAKFEGREQLSIHWRAFELNPDAAPTAPLDGSYAERLAAKYEVPVAEGQAMVDRMTATAAAEGLTFDFDRIRPGNTFDAHRLMALAAAGGQADAMGERLMRAYMTEGESIGDREVLVRLGAEVGLAEDAVRALLATDDLADRVRADEAEAARLGIGSVPTFVVDGRAGLAGAQPPEALLALLEAGGGSAG